jgi:hypothetical protein
MPDWLGFVLLIALHALAIVGLVEVLRILMGCA